jgi:hypothetical protein
MAIFYSVARPLVATICLLSGILVPAINAFGFTNRSGQINRAWAELLFQVSRDFGKWSVPIAPFSGDDVLIDAAFLMRLQFQMFRRPSHVRDDAAIINPRTKH